MLRQVTGKAAAAVCEALEDVEDMTPFRGVEWAIMIVSVEVMREIQDDELGIVGGEAYNIDR